MKKFMGFTAVCAAAIFGAAAFSACRDTGKYSVYCPDGAPALSLLSGLSKGDEAFEYHIVASATVPIRVTGENPTADFCVLPLNLASNLLGEGTTYRMLGAVTHGNLFFLTTGENEMLSSENLSSLVGKTVGTVQLTNVPGLTLQLVLKQNEISYQTIESLQAERAEDKVNLLELGADASNVTPAFGCDYYLCPEPAATLKIKGTANAPKPFKLAGSLQTLYGGEEGYPQAVLVAKKSVIQRDKKSVEKLVSYFKENAEYLKNVDTATVRSLLDGVRTRGLNPAFNENNLNAQIIQNCSVRYQSAQECKTSVNAFLKKLVEVNPNAAKTVSDAFYYSES